MKFVPNKTKGKEPSTYKTLYLKEVLVKEIWPEEQKMFACLELEGILKKFTNNGK